MPPVFLQFRTLMALKSELATKNATEHYAVQGYSSLFGVMNVTIIIIIINRFV